MAEVEVVVLRRLVVQKGWVVEDKEDCLLNPDTEREFERRYQLALKIGNAQRLAEIINTRERLRWYIHTFFPKQIPSSDRPA